MFTPQNVVHRWFKTRRGASRKVFHPGLQLHQRFPCRKCLHLVIYKSLSRILMIEAILKRVNLHYNNQALRQTDHVSTLHGRPRKNNHPFGIYEHIKLGLINYTLLSLIKHMFSLTLAIMSVTSDKVTSGTIVMINTLQKLIYSRCRIMFILCFMPKRSI